MANNVPAEGAAEVVEGEEVVAEEEEKLNRRLVLHGEPAQSLPLPNQPRLGNTMIDLHMRLACSIPNLVWRDLLPLRPRPPSSALMLSMRWRQADEQLAVLALCVLARRRRLPPPKARPLPLPRLRLS